ncbi:TolC family protein [Teredinibacter turnerae]|uniref:TolC family protein n=1 Tax=Teredinibacter turnerae TaxID=2426 RepID=UPI00036203BC|nr:TolC family protein [Teredinibacter turnerae]
MTPKHFLKTIVSTLVLTVVVPVASAESISLEQAVARANTIDPWLLGSEKQQESLEAMSVQAGTLPDPSVNVAIANLPVDSFDFAQEGMTQFKVNVSQMFPRGNSRALKREKLAAMSKVQPYMRQDRIAQVANTVSQLWLDVYLLERTISLIEKDRHLFEHLVDVSQSSYTTTSGKARQQDLVRAQLELTRLDDRLTRLRQMRDMKAFQLSEWLQVDDLTINQATAHTISLHSETVLKTHGNNRTELLVDVLRQHPLLLAIERKIATADTGVRLSKQSYKPQWGLSASYGYRDDAPNGMERADFFSAGVTFDVPLFTGKRQDKLVQSAKADKEAIKTERALALRKLRAGYDSTEASYRRLLDRQTLFDTRLLKEMAEQAEASLTAYTNDDGDFAEVVRARIAELNARIEALNVRIDIQKTIAQMNYFLVGAQLSGANNE